VLDVNSTAPLQLSFPGGAATTGGAANEIVGARKINKAATIKVRILNTDIMELGALVFQIMDCKQNKCNHLLITRALILKKIRGFSQSKLSISA
jgi:hypothetical protein